MSMSGRLPSIIIDPATRRNRLMTVKHFSSGVDYGHRLFQTRFVFMSTAQSHAATRTNFPQAYAVVFHAQDSLFSVLASISYSVGSFTGCASSKVDGILTRKDYRAVVTRSMPPWLVASSPFSSPFILEMGVQFPFETASIIPSRTRRSKKGLEDFVEHTFGSHRQALRVFSLWTVSLNFQRKSPKQFSVQGGRGDQRRIRGQRACIFVGERQCSNFPDRKRKQDGVVALHCSH